MQRRKTVALLLATTAVWVQGFAAQAQEAVQVAQQGTQPADGESEADTDRVVITGSRLQTGFSAPSPTTVVGVEQIQSQVPGGISELLSEMPSFRASSGPVQSQRNLVGPLAGQATSDLRGLGAPRTLTLVNGRRFVSTNTAGSVNTQVIPVGLIERIEVVTGGASAAYGSDAVAGVVNFILRDGFEGVSGSFHAGQSRYGDNNEFGGNLNAGMSFADGRGSAIIGVDFNLNDGIGNIYSRPRTSIEPGNTATPITFSGANRPPGTPSRGFLPMVEFSAMTKGSVITGARTATGAGSTALNFIAFDEDGLPFNFLRGTIYGNLMQGVTTNYGSTPLSNWGLKTPNDRATGMLLINYDLAESTEVFLEATYARTDIDGFSSYHTQPRVTILRDNPFLPQVIRDQMVQRNLTEIDIGRVDSEWGGALTHNTFDTLSIASGFKGEIFDTWTWDAYVQYGRTLGIGRLNHTRESSLLAAQYVVTGPNGQPMCGPLATNPNFAASRLSALVNPDFVLPNCVPFNPFGIGNNTNAAIDYVSGEQLTKLDIRQNVAAASLAGDLLALPAGALTVATGIEYREESVRQTADPLQERGIYTNGNNKSWSGKNKVVEGFVEAGVPLLRDLPLIDALDLNAAVRHTNYQTSGAVTTWKVGLTYEPNDLLRFRGTRSRDIRAPNLAELFSFSGSVLPANSVFNPFNGVTERLTTTTRGNPFLTPEIADTVTAGIVFEPTWDGWSGLRASLDFYDITIEGVVSAVASSDVLNRCFAGNQNYCQQIEFVPQGNGNIRNINLAPFNQAELSTSGVDFEIAYGVPIEEFGIPGELNINSLVNYTDKLERVDVPGPAAIAVDYAGYSMGGGTPKLTGTFGVNYALDGLRVGLRARVFSEIRYDPSLIGPDEDGYSPTLPNSINVNRFPSVPYFSMNASYDFAVGEAKMQLFGAIDNLLNRQPPILAIAALNSGGNPYDYVGRNFKVGLRFQW